jgi:hypothetical protein
MILCRSVYNRISLPRHLYLALQLAMIPDDYYNIGTLDQIHF